MWSVRGGAMERSDPFAGRSAPRLYRNPVVEDGMRGAGR